MLFNAVVGAEENYKYFLFPVQHPFAGWEIVRTFPMKENMQMILNYYAQVEIIYFIFLFYSNFLGRLDTESKALEKYGKGCR